MLLMLGDTLLPILLIINAKTLFIALLFFVIVFIITLANKIKLNKLPRRQVLIIFLKSVMGTILIAIIIFIILAIVGVFTFSGFNKIF